jgi:hypothetical protein
MGIKLVFTIQRDVFNIEVVGREIFYSDRIWKNKIRLIPEDEKFALKIAMSRNRYPNVNLDTFKMLFKLSDEDKAEYDSAKTEEELALICIKDVRSKGGVLRKREDNE